MTTFTGEYGNTYELVKQIGAGGQATVYQVQKKDADADCALKWYHRSQAVPEQEAQIRQLIEAGVPKITADDVQFIWPLEIVRHHREPGFGYIMPLIDADRFFNLQAIRVGRRRPPRMDALCRASYGLCMALEAIHRQGMAYCDINPGNVMIEPKSGAILICDNDNVVVNNTTPRVLGLDLFMAPEVALGDSAPNRDSDLYSLAIFLYYLWCWEHPMEGKRTLAVNSWDIPARRRHFAQEPLFVHHPSDDSNHGINEPDLQTSIKRWEIMCPPSLKQAFTQVFTEGVADSKKRIRLSDWRNLFQQMEANSIVCDCGAANVVEPHLADQNCFHCRAPLPVYLYAQGQNGRVRLALFPGATLRQHHLDIHGPMDQATTVLGEVEPHPRKKQVVGIRNQTNQPWICFHNNTQQAIEPGQARPLLPGMEIIIGNTRFVVSQVGK